MKAIWDRTRYPDDWDIIALEIKERDGWCCRWCGIADGTKLPGRKRPIWLVVAHLGVPHPDGRPGDKRDKMDCRPENLAALCPHCHGQLDADERLPGVRQTKQRRNKRLPAA
jgi:hypothetical protein